ncbi:electron transport complex subunit RsxC [Saccharophagus sp. K07]|uniref:electron transport complex subunit RsxC n=1 Tax=Saccharophagus sp. K07 TaxID=2283636 RepID=UPI00165284A7|nr:electron transport complex subunit RsxC [Saccharophagus sp. K07]MBC6904586.1 electron transport complex subunit RsxC [Saccharophagus sp. K07]
MRKIWDIHGGVHPPENKHQSLRDPLATIALPNILVLPLNQHIGSPATPVVQVGQKVLKGELIADAQGIFSACIHAPTSGEIVAIEDRPIAHPSGLSAPCIVLRPDGLDQWTELTPCEAPETLDHATLVEKIRRAGLAGMGGAGFPTAVKLNPRSTDKIETLILNGTECEPYITADDMLMRVHAEEVVQGALLLARIVGNPKEILIGIEDNKPEAVATMQAAAQGTGIEVVVFPTKYPSGGEKQLIQILTGKEVPSGKIPAQIGVLVQNVGTAYAAWRAVRYGEPLIERITTVVGESLDIQRNIRVLIGTPIAHVLEQHGFAARNCARVIIGGPMMGYSIEDLQVPVVKTTNCVLAPSHAEMPPAPPAQACIRCGMCAQACPANLLPQQLYWYAQAEDFDRLENHNLFDCIECGACTFVCPSAIPLVQYYRAAKTEIRRKEAEKQKSDRARERFEQRKERIAKAEAEKEAKRLARKKAAEAVKAQMEEPKAAPAVQTFDPVAVAQNKAESLEDKDSIGKKLTRQLESVKGRVEHLTQQIAECEDPARKDALTAQLKQAELKLEEARKKLDDFERGISAPLEQRLEKVAQKVQLSPLEAQRNAIATIEKRLAVAIEKMQEAEREEKPTLPALKQGVEKLQEKLAEAQAELAQLEQQQTAEPTANAGSSEPQDAAAEAIARAQAKAAAAAQMSPEEKRAEQIKSLQARIEKARAKVIEAEASNSEHLPALRTALEKLESKLQEAEQQA